MNYVSKLVIVFLLCGIALPFSYSQGTNLLLNEVMSLNNTTLKDADGDDPDWIEIYNSSTENIQLEDYYLSDEEGNLLKWRLPNVELAAEDYILIYASGKYVENSPKYSLHTNFKLDSEGEWLYLSSATEIIDKVFTDKLSTDISLGRIQNETMDWRLFNQPTPGQINNTTAYLDYAADVSVSVSGGFYSASQNVSLSTLSSGATIRYSLDGSEPNEKSTVYSATLTVGSTKVLKCKAFETDFLPGRTEVHTYFINEDKTMPVLSLSTHPDNLFDDDIGIYIEGNGTAMGGYPSSPVGPPANYWEDWERPVHIEFFEPDGKRGVSIDVGMKMFGKVSRRLPQKSFALFARSEYGASEINYRLFPNLDIFSFKSVLFRNSGSENISENGATHFRDGLASTVVTDLDMEKQAYRPCIVYINGEYWGIYGLREKNNEDFLAAHHKIDPKKVDILDDYHTLYPLVVEGSADHFNDLLDYLELNGTKEDADANYVSTQMNVENFITYMASQIYFVNQDGPGHNCKFWRTQSPEGRYRWILYDADFSFGMRTFVPSEGPAPYAYENNTISYYRETDGPNWPNPPESTYTFRKILENTGFRNSFINRCADLMNSVFKEEVVLRKADSIAELMEPEIEDHIKRWGRTKREWLENVDIIRDFADNRPTHFRRNIISEFNLSGSMKLTINISPSDAGVVKVNSLSIGDNAWEGIYFKNVPVELNALAMPGYKFKGWTGIEATDVKHVNASFEKNTIVTAQFEKISDATPKILINEISYLPNDKYNAGDWIELYNPNGKAVDISDWTIQGDDTGVKYYFSKNTFIPSDGYLVIAKNYVSFKNHYPDLQNVKGELLFDIKDEGETLILQNQEKQTINSLTFSANSPWPNVAESNSKTIALQYGIANNTVAEKWGKSVLNGTPGKRNQLEVPIIVNSIESITQNINDKSRIYPNPFSESTVIEFTLNSSKYMQITVYGVLGNEITRLLNEELSAGTHQVNWDGTSQNGDVVKNGLYLIKIETEEGISSEKVLMIR